MVPPGRVEILSYRQELHLKSGLLLRDIRFRDGAGRTTRWNERRLVSMAQPHLAALAVEVTPENWAGQLAVQTALDGSSPTAMCGIIGTSNRHLEPLELHNVGADVIFLRARTNQSLIRIAEAARTRLYRNDAEVDG